MIEHDGAGTKVNRLKKIGARMSDLSPAAGYREDPNKCQRPAEPCLETRGEDRTGVGRGQIPAGSSEAVGARSGDDHRMKFQYLVQILE